MSFGSSVYCRRIVCVVGCDLANILVDSQIMRTLSVITNFYLLLIYGQHHGTGPVGSFAVDRGTTSESS
jgi:hypothetical protein